MDRVYVFGSKGSLLATRDALIARSSSADNRESSPDGNPASLSALPHGKSNPIAYLLSQIHSNDPVEDPLSGQLNVQVMEILDAARESARTGRTVELR